ncbi:conserved membrane hypothetical protein [Microbacterium sp. 8M]|uniref:DUF3159 domain-containing protein n=1 Tax=Microbacterium sp. 8M TaxID=2653153 RepID=UPI0012F3F8FD|nr:conserved membrane hypothetical protein [Microbacterium sp. 8M]
MSTPDETEASREPAAERYAPPPAPDAVQSLGAALGGAAQRLGIDPNSGAGTGHVVWRAMGGWRGVLESVLPSAAFLIIYTLRPDPLWVSLVVSVGLAAVFSVIRLLQRSPAASALGGLVAVAAAAGLALWTGRGQDNFVPGFFTNAAYGTVLLISALAGWALIGVAAGFLMGDVRGWRQDARKRRAFFWLTVAWAALFFARLAVQLPLYFAGNVQALGTLKLVMGLPLFAPMVALTWLVVRALYPPVPDDDTATGER